jgi:hypothetical protein
MDRGLCRGQFVEVNRTLLHMVAAHEVAAARACVITKYYVGYVVSWEFWRPSQPVLTFHPNS